MVRKTLLLQCWHRSCRYICSFKTWMIKITALTHDGLTLSIYLTLTGLCSLWPVYPEALTPTRTVELQKPEKVDLLTAPVISTSTRAVKSSRNLVIQRGAAVQWTAGSLRGRCRRGKVAAFLWEEWASRLVTINPWYYLAICQMSSLPRKSPVTHSIISSEGSHPLHSRLHHRSSGSDGSLMVCSPYTAINLFIGHLPASWRYISGGACVCVCECLRGTLNAAHWCVWYH